jgi:3-oxoacyl-[acyl-carrier protein] reductase
MPSAVGSPLFTKNRRVFLTGASRGIGLAIKKEFESHGLEVVGPKRDELDLSDAVSVERFLGKNFDLNCDILVNNAGINFPAPIEKIGLTEWSSAMQVNLTAPFLLSRYFAQSMRESGWGRIVNISSVFSLVTKEGRAVYSAAKSALNGLTRTCAVEWGADGVLVNAILPGYIDTALTRQNNTAEALNDIRKQIPLRRLAEPEEIARMVVFLSSEMNTYMTGQSVVVDGGFTLR